MPAMNDFESFFKETITCQKLRKIIFLLSYSLFWSFLEVMIFIINKSFISVKQLFFYKQKTMHEFQIVKQLGSGSFGRVLKVVKRQKNIQKEFAIKQVKMNQLSSKEKDNALNEIRLLASIDSPYIIKYKSAFLEEKNNTLCIVMEYADGGDLQGLTKRKIAKNHKFNENFIWQVAYDLLRGLKVLHSNKIIHRDIKPANIFFVDGVAKLGDLNVSKVMQGKFAMTQTGTPYYTSPEIWNNRSYDYRCDIWSLGCVLYELCVLNPPFMARDLPGLSKKIVAGYYDPIPQIYSKKLSSMIKRCLTVDMNRRPTADDLLKEDVFGLLQKNQQGDVQLLDTIRCPKVLKFLNEKLPDDQYEPPKKVKTLKFIEANQEAQNPKGFDKEVRSMKKIGSQANIRSQSKLRVDRLMSKEKEKQNQFRPFMQAQIQTPIQMPMQVPFQSPKGIVKLPRIPSCKNIY